MFDSGRAAIQKILLQGTDSAAQLAGELQGQGVEGIPSAALTDGSGGTVVWRIIREESDTIGMRHVFYRQYYIPPSWISTGLDPRYATNGVEVTGSEIGLHFAKDSTLSAVFGTQAPAVIIANSSAIMSVEDAYGQAQQAVKTQPGFAP